MRHQLLCFGKGDGHYSLSRMVLAHVQVLKVQERLALKRLLDYLQSMVSGNISNTLFFYGMCSLNVIEIYLTALTWLKLLTSP